MTIAGLWRYGDWRHVATGSNALVCLNYNAKSGTPVQWTGVPLCKVAKWRIGFATIPSLSPRIYQNKYSQCRH